MPAQLVGVAAGKAFALLLHSPAPGELPNSLGMGLAIISPQFRALIHDSNSPQVWDIHMELVDVTQDLQDHKAALGAGI